MKKFIILFALLITACNPSAPPADADVAILFTKDGCELLKAPEGDVPNPIRIAAKNPTNSPNAIVTVTLMTGSTREDLEAYPSDDLPPFVAGIVDHMDPEPEGDWLIQKLELESGRENFFVCAQEGVGVLSVPLVLTP